MAGSLENLVHLTEHEPEQVLWVLENKEALETTDLCIAKYESVDQDDHKNEQFNHVDIFPLALMGFLAPGTAHA